MGYNAADFAGNGAGFLKAADLKAEGLTSVQVKIINVDCITFPANDKGPEETKLVLEFEEYEKTFPLNKTNTRSMMNLYGPDTDPWFEKDIILNVGMVSTPTGPQETLTITGIPQARPQRPSSPAQQAAAQPVGAGSGSARRPLTKADDPFKGE